jgi:hypothetical protein
MLRLDEILKRKCNTVNLFCNEIEVLLGHFKGSIWIMGLIFRKEVHIQADGKAATFSIDELISLRSATAHQNVTVFRTSYSEHFWIRDLRLCYLGPRFWLSLHLVLRLLFFNFTYIYIYIYIYICWKYRVLQKELYSGIPNVAVWNVTKTFTLKGVQTIHRSRFFTPLSVTFL